MKQFLISIIFIFFTVTNVKADKDKFFQFNCENSDKNFTLIEKVNANTRVKFDRANQDLGYIVSVENKYDIWSWGAAGRSEKKAGLRMFFYNYAEDTLETNHVDLTDKEYNQLVKRAKTDVMKLTLGDLKWKIFLNKRKQKAKIKRYKTKCKQINYWEK